MKLGYACINTALPTKFRTCRLKTVEINGLSYVKELTLLNLHETLSTIKWNIQHDIFFYRLSSDLVPFSSHPINTWEWWDDEDVLMITNQIKDLQKKHNLRLTCHPGQFNVLNSPNEQVVQKTIEELTYHQKLMGLVNGSDMILHVGGVYGDKEEAKKRFIERYKQLPSSIKQLLRIENDDKSFTLQDTVDLHHQTNAPICFDIHHHHCHNNGENLDELLPYVWKSWERYGTPKVHISTGKEHKTDRRHHDYVSQEDFSYLLSLLKNQEVDVMFEAKTKEQAVLYLQHKQNS